VRAAFAAGQNEQRQTTRVENAGKSWEMRGRNKAEAKAKAQPVRCIKA